jgi:protein-S-isoprenylcysteine O-methyltransferase Ste14
VGLPLVLAGLWLAAWAVSAAADVALGRSDRLVRGGPYAFTRNPMHLIWTLGYGGIALAADAAWPLLLATEVVVVREESVLD